MTGQDAVNSSQVFSRSLDISGIILTKMDADTRGGAAVSIKEVTGINIKFIGNGETVNDLEVFNPDSMARRILGMGDVISFVEKAKDMYDSEEAQKNQQKLLDGSFNLEDFQKQLKQFNQIGSMDKMIQMLPVKGMKKMGNMNDKQIVWMNGIINSMTIKEKQNPDIIDGSRRKRIALGSGRSIFEVNQLLKQLFQIKTMMKKINKKGIFPFNFK
jgi:signal recognition particle subunit SRP54